MRRDRYLALLLRVLPATFRERHGEELTALAERMKRDLGPDPSALALLRFYVAVTWDVLRHLRDVRSPTGPTRRLRPTVHRRTALVSALDVKLALRMLAKHPLLTVVSALALGLGIPASLAPIHVWRAVMAPLPFEEGARIVGIRAWNVRAARPEPVSLGDFEHWRERLTAFDEIGAARRAPWNVQLPDGRAEPVRGAEITASLFDVLRVRPALGRPFQPSDELSSGADVAIIGAELWASLLGRSADVIGSTVRVAGVPHTVVGVMPEGFTFPRDEVLWLPLRGEGANGLQVVGRLAAGASIEAAQSQAEGLGLASEGAAAPSAAALRPEVVTTAVHRAEIPAGGESDPLVYAVQVLALVLLLIACGNVGIMLLARTSARSGEIAVRGALGASRGRIVGQLFVEGLVLALLATGVGLAAASWAVRRFEAIPAPEFAMMDLGIGWRTVTSALCLSLLCAGVASLVPALKATSGGIHGRLGRHGGRGSGPRFGAVSTALIVAELALSVGLLSYGVVWTRTVLRDTSGEMGIDLDRYLSAHVLMFDPVHGADVESYPEELAGRLAAVQVELKRRLESEPGVRAVAVASGGDLPGTRNAPRRVEVEGLAPNGDARGTVVAWSRVDPDFFRDLDRPILRGRDFARSDLPAERGAHRAPAIVNTTFVDQVLGGRNPIGRRLRYTNDADPDTWYEIVGVVGPLGLNPVNPELDAGVYHPAAPGEINAVGIVIDVDDPMSFIPRLRRIAGEVDPAAMVRRPMLLSQLAELEWTGLRYLALAPVIVSLIAMLLSAAGLYAVMTFSVSQRTREIGIRAALGASRTGVVATVGRRAALQLGLGALLGSAFAVPLLLSTLSDPLIKPQSPAFVILGVASGLFAVGFLACAAPALRAARIQPVEALRDG